MKEEAQAVELEVSIDSEPSIAVRAEGGETLEAFADRISDKAQVNGEGILEEALKQEVRDFRSPVRDAKFSDKRVKVRRTCVEVHFESEHQRASFPVGARWALVHRWGCRNFDVAHDACANLELRADSSTGAPINETQKIGAGPDCRVVWLVKPGPEPNG